MGNQAGASGLLNRDIASARAHGLLDSLHIVVYLIARVHRCVGLWVSTGLLTGPYAGQCSHCSDARISASLLHPLTTSGWKITPSEVHETGARLLSSLPLWLVRYLSY